MSSPSAAVSRSVTPRPSAFRKNARLMVAWGATLLLSSSLVWAISWYRPAQTVGVVLVGAGYQTNLAVPHNVPGWEALNDLANYASSPASSSNTSLRRRPTTLRTGFQWSEVLDDTSDDTLLLYIAAHGAADLEGPYLLPHDSTGTREERLRLTDLWQALAALPDDQHKLVCFDVTLLSHEERLGILNNGFARRLNELNAQISQIPNLVVICSSGVDQQGWIDPQLHRSLFGSRFLQCLAGKTHDANHDGRINAAELYDDLHTQLSQWGRQHRSAEQTPLLLPQGDEGRQRATRLELIVASEHATEPVEQDLTPLVEQSQQAWQRYDTLMQSNPAPYAFAPLFWREYVDTLVRCDELLGCGDAESAQQLQAALQSLQYRMMSEQNGVHGSLENSLACHAVMGGEKLPLAAAGKLLVALALAPPSHRPALWNAAVASVNEKTSGGEHYLRLALFTALYQRTIDDPAQHLATAHELVLTVRSPLLPLPAEIQFLCMLHEHLPAEALTGASLPLVKQALGLRALAERAAVGWSTDQPSYTMERCRPWIQAKVAEADRARRFGEDLLFAAEEDRLRAAPYLEESRQAYEAVLTDAQRVQAAYAARDRVLALLPYYAHWLVETETDPRTIDQADPVQLQRTIQLWEEVHQLGDMLADPNPQWIELAPPPSTNNPRPHSLVDRTLAVNSQFVRLEARFRQSAQQLASGKVAADAPALCRALQVPQSDYNLRQQLNNRLQEVSLAEPAQPEQEVRAKPVPSESHSAHEVAQRAAQRAITTARWHGELALALLGRNLFAQYHTTHSETYNQVAYRLEMASVEPKWWVSVTTAAEQLASRWEYQPKSLAEAMQQTAVDNPHSTLKAIALADRLIRQIDGAQAARLVDRPDVAQRCFVLHQLANYLAERALLDHWYDLDPHAEPYFTRVANAYLADAQRLYPDSPETNELRQRVTTSSDLQLANMAPLTLTTQLQLQLQYELQPTNGSAPVPGFPVCWLTSGPHLELLEPAANQRVVRRLDEQHPSGNIAVGLRSPLLEEAARTPGTSPEPVASKLVLHAFFRGQHLLTEAPVWLHPVPEIAMIRHPLPVAAAVSINQSDRVRHQFSVGRGAIAFVLDASGSMGPANGQRNVQHSKYAQATEALEQVLAKVPAGTQISLWTFGAARGPQRTALAAETTIEQVQAPLTWDPADAALRTRLLKSIDPEQVLPWNESPIVRTILAAQADLAGTDGFRSMVVITDGQDNRFAQDRMANPNSQSIPAALTTAFEDSGISLNVIGFQVVGAEAAEMQRQFSVVEKLHPAGRFESVDQAEALAETLAAALQRTLRFQLEPLGSNRMPTPLELGQLGGGEVWPLEGVEPGAYRIHLSQGAPLGTTVQLEPGDCLSLTLDTTSAGLCLQHESYAERAYPQQPAVDNAAWRASCLQNQGLAGGGYRGAFSLEPSGSQTGSHFQQSTPSFLWFELMGTNSEQQPAALAWRRMVGYPMACWNLTAENWPSLPNAQQVDTPQVRMWWSVNRTPAYAATALRTDPSRGISQLAGVALQAAEQAVQIESLTTESHYVEVAPGRRELRNCLVVRLSHTPGKVYWAEPLGLETAGAEQRFYPSVGSYTGLFWPVSEEQVQRGLKGVGLLSLDQVKQEAERHGRTLQFDQLPAPDPHDSLPTPLFTFDL